MAGPRPCGWRRCVQWPVMTTRVNNLLLLIVLVDRSEEHTSELQSQSNLVCRLLLEKKKKSTAANSPTYRQQRFHLSLHFLATYRLQPQLLTLYDCKLLLLLSLQAANATTACRYTQI